MADLVQMGKFVPSNFIFMIWNDGLSIITLSRLIGLVPTHADKLTHNRQGILKNTPTEAYE